MGAKDTKNAKDRELLLAMAGVIDQLLVGHPNHPEPIDFEKVKLRTDRFSKALAEVEFD